MKKIQIPKQNYQFFKRKHCLKKLPKESDFPQQDSIYYTYLPPKYFFNGRKFFTLVCKNPFCTRRKHCNTHPKIFDFLNKNYFVLAWRNWFSSKTKKFLYLPKKYLFFKRTKKSHVLDKPKEKISFVYQNISHFPLKESSFFSQKAISF